MSTSSRRGRLKEGSVEYCGIDPHGIMGVQDSETNHDLYERLYLSKYELAYAMFIGVAMQTTTTKSRSSDILFHCSLLSNQDLVRVIIVLLSRRKSLRGRVKLMPFISLVI